MKLMSFFPNVYVNAFEIALIVRENSRKRFRDGVERAAAMAAIKERSVDGFVDAMGAVFEQFELRHSRWDGSIG